MEEETDYWQCPNCGGFFTIEEFDAQHCGVCGWPESLWLAEEDEDEYIDIGQLGWPYDGTDDGER